MNLHKRPKDTFGRGDFCLKNMDENFVYCVFCESTRESKVELFLKNLGYNVISALAERKVVKNGKTIKELRSIIPGYVFFENDNEPEWNEIIKSKHIYYPIRYGNNEKKLRDNDLRFVKWLMKNRGIIKISKAVEIGKKIKIIEGPLKEMEGNIVKINKKQKCVGVNIEGEGIKNIIWLSYEYIKING
jgi:transcriptional antiterminator NusG